MTDGQEEALPTLRGRVRALMSFTFVVIGAIALLTAVSFIRLLDARETVLDELDPVSLRSSALLTTLIDQEAAVRGFALSGGSSAFVGPYERALSEAEALDARLRDDLDDHPELGRELDDIEAALAIWTEEYAAPTLAIERRVADLADADQLERGRALFEAVRDSFVDFQATLDGIREDAVNDLNTATIALLLAVGALATMSISAKVLLWRTFNRAVALPLRQLGEDAIAVASGDLGRRIRRPHHAELAELGTAMEDMRARLVADLHTLEETYEALERQAEELERSNSDLEQFAYVASHDLQEPLRKVISFSQLLQSRYGGQLDDRADQYIAFAVDAAKRMQTLINDLLAFSRVGRLGGEHIEIDLDDPLDQALDNLALAVEETGAVVERGDLPVVKGDPALLVSLFQNLIGNAIKFRREDVPPHISIDAVRDGDAWTVHVTDNGIGIDPQFEDRVFVIFQRLHGKDAYGGTGIGLAMCRKIVEHHGGRIWIERVDGPGTRFCIALPDPSAHPPSTTDAGSAEPTTNEPMEAADT